MTFFRWVLIPTLAASFHFMLWSSSDTHRVARNHLNVLTSKETLSECTDRAQTISVLMMICTAVFPPHVHTVEICPLHLVDSCCSRQWISEASVSSCLAPSLNAKYVHTYSPINHSSNTNLTHDWTLLSHWLRVVLISEVPLDNYTNSASFF